MTEFPFQQFGKVLDYLYDEKKDYEESGEPDNHIWNDVRDLQNWFDEHPMNVHDWPTCPEGASDPDDEDNYCPVCYPVEPHKQKTTIKMCVTKQGDQYLGECMEFPVMTHGRTLEELGLNMEKALNLFLADEKPSEAEDKAEPEEVVSLEVELN